MRRLYTRIYLHFLFVLIVAGVVVSLVSASNWRGEYRRRMAERLTTLTAVLVGEYFENPTERDQFIQRIANELSLDVTVRDMQGQVVVSSGKMLAPLKRKDLAQLSVENPLFLHDPRPCAATLIRNAKGENLGVLQSAWSRPPPALAWAQPVLTVVLALLAIGVAIVPLARRISHPVDELTIASGKLGAGELSYRITVPEQGAHKSDELTKLSLAWNDMAARIEALVSGHKELLANVSHELRSPLARIRLAIELLPESARSQQRVRDVEQDLSELDRLIEAVLTTSRLDARELQIKPAPVEVRELLLALAERAKNDGSPAIAVDAPEDLVITADAALLSRALWNLIENAGKYGAAPFSLRAQVTNNAVRISMSDEGEGIAESERERVFTPFYRGDKARTPNEGGKQGFGLGLTLVGRIARAHQGNVSITSTRDGRGCTVTVETPLA